VSTELKKKMVNLENVGFRSDVLFFQASFNTRKLSNINSEMAFAGLKKQINKANQVNMNLIFHLPLRYSSDNYYVLPNQTKIIL